MASGKGATTLDFGAGQGSNEASVVVVGSEVAGITEDASVEAYVMSVVGADETPEHTAADHRYFAALVGLTVGNVVPGVGFTVYARSLEKLTGRFSVHFVWVD